MAAYIPLWGHPAHRDHYAVLGTDPQDLVLHEGLQLLDDDDGLLPADEIGDLPLRKGVGEPELQDGDPGHELLHIAIGDPRGYDPYVPLALYPVERGCLRHLPGLLHPLQQPDPVVDGVGGDVDEVLVVLVEMTLEGGVRPYLPEDDVGTGVVDAGGRPVQERKTQLLGYGIRLGQEVLRLLGV